MLTWDAPFAAMRRDPGAGPPVAARTGYRSFREDIAETLTVVPPPPSGAVQRDAGRLRRAEPAGNDPVREFRPVSAPESAEQALCPRSG
jgi:hypothetical protein